jgi:predicted DNA-binding protein with PD1-like motif
MLYRLLLLTVAGASSLVHAQDLPPGYLVRTVPKPGMAPGMKVTEFSKTARTFELVFSKGDEVASGLTDFARKNHIKVCHFTAIGAFDSAVLGWFDPEKRAYKKILIDQEVEVASFSGSITLRDGVPSVHAHMVAALPDGTTRGGHFVEGHVSLTLQVFLDVLEEESR